MSTKALILIGLVAVLLLSVAGLALESIPPTHDASPEAGEALSAARAALAGDLAAVRPAGLPLGGCQTSTGVTCPPTRSL